MTNGLGTGQQFGVPVPGAPAAVQPPQAGASSETARAVPATMQGAGADMAAVTVASRIAPFWKDMPKLWFRQFESIMAPQKLSSEAKFDLVITKLNREELSAVADLLEDGAGREYAALKDRLISTYQESEDSQFNRLVREMELGEQRPSQLYRRMAEAARNAGVAESTLRKLWVQRLPTAIKVILSTTSEDTKLSDLVAIADKIMESMSTGAVAAVEAPAAVATPSTSTLGADMIQEFRNMVLEVKHLRGEISELRSRAGEGMRYDRNRSRSRSRSRASRPRSNWLCHYHYKFRERATKCRQPCNWQQQPVSADGAAPPTQWQPYQGN
jgi:hypothetical protein